MKLRNNWRYFGPSLVHPVMRHIFADTVQLNCIPDLTPCHTILVKKGPWLHGARSPLQNILNTFDPQFDF